MIKKKDIEGNKMIRKVYSSKIEAVVSIFCIVLLASFMIVSICNLINGFAQSEDIIEYIAEIIIFSFLISLCILWGNREAYTVTYNHKEKMLYRRGFFFGYKYQLKVEDIEEVVIGTFYREGTYYILVDPYNNRYDACYKKSFIRLQATDKNREFIELFWHRPITKEMPKDAMIRNK